MVREDQRSRQEITQNIYAISWDTSHTHSYTARYDIIDNDDDDNDDDDDKNNNNTIIIIIIMIIIIIIIIITL